MTVDQLPGGVREFADYLDGLLARLEPGGGWCAVFWQRDPDGMRACLEGREVPPWDVVEALLQDLAAGHGPGTAASEKDRARVLHAAALSAYDARPGGRDALGDRLDVLLRERKYAAERLAELGRLLASAPTGEAAEALRRDLAWARDDHHRATARCAELRARMADFDRRALADRAQDTHPIRPTGAGGGVVPRTGEEDARRDPRPARPDLPEPHPSHSPAPPPPKQRKRRRGGARFAGAAEDDGTAPVVVPPVAAPAPPAPVAPVAPPGRTLRGARFAGAGETAQAPAPVPAQTETGDATARREAAAVAEALARLRAAGHSGEAHALLAEAAHWPAARFPLLAAELERAGLGADWATLLWETASLPAERLVAAADALTAAGRDTDARQILRQGVARPAAEIGQAVLAMTAGGRRREADTLLDAYVRVRTPEETARSAAADPPTLVPLLLEAAGRVSAQRHWDVVHALRVAGLTT
ncbi:hypothetical protein [Streptomyces sp.]|uniref:hypothetical protein n=1 Tax=Streptomyces sp. TaxID=1931 RepID=UPI002D676552|nr:hypothetical protein [Streptomyces sp.]HZF88221.1 hypothetical protein [Streptomyces sp.]